MKKFIIALLALNINIYPQWIKQNPIEALHYLTSFDCIGSDIIWAVGDTGTVIKTVDGGNSWIDINIGTRTALSAVKFVNSIIGFICGDSGKVYKTTNAGNNWFNLSIGSGERLMSMSFPDANTGYIAGLHTIFKTTNGGNNWIVMESSNDNYFYDVFFINTQTGWIGNISYTDHLFKTTNGGMYWTRITNVTGWPVGEIFFVNENTGWFCTLGSMGPAQVNKTTNGGLNWGSQSLGGSYRIQDVYFFDVNTGWTVGGNYCLYRTTNSGASWIEFEKYTGMYLSNILFANNLTGYAMGSTGDIAKTTNGGMNWVNCSKIISKDLSSVKFVNENTGFISGGGGMFAKTSNSGIDWDVKNTNTIIDLYRMNLINENSIWLFDFYKLLLKSTNQGETWQHIQIMFNYWHDMCFADLNTDWICGDTGKIIKTTNGGLNWFQLSAGLNDNILQIKSFDHNKLISALRSQSYPYNSTVMFSSDGGYNWTVISEIEVGQYYRLYILNQNLGWVFKLDGQNGILYKTSNSGINWLSIIPNLDDIGNFKFVSENNAYGIIGSLFLKTINGGVNWALALLPNYTYSYSDLSFINENTGWVVGNQGYILKTTNGGGPIGIQPISNEIPKTFILHQNYPNPFNPATKIRFSLPNPSEGGAYNVKLIIYDILGREVITLINEHLSVGVYEAEWNTNDYPSGVYFYRLTAGDYSETKKMVLIK